MTEAIISIILLCCSIGLLWKGSDWLVNSAAHIGRSLGMSDLVIGLTIVAFGTSAPEFAVTISAALGGRSFISVGNVVGSNIFNLGFILGGCALIKVLKTPTQLVYRDGLLLIGTAIAVTYMLHDYYLSGMEGLLLLIVLCVYILSLIIGRKKLDEEIPEGKAAGKDYLLLIVGIAMVIGGGHLLVLSASELALFFGLSEWVIAVTIVAAGTSAPEFATSLMAATKGRHGMSLGNLIGSDLFNLLGVLGLAALIRPMGVAESSLHSMYMLVGMCILTVVFMRSGWKVSRLEGGILVTLGFLRWGMDFWG